MDAPLYLPSSAWEEPARLSKTLTYLSLSIASCSNTACASFRWMPSSPGLQE